MILNPAQFFCINNRISFPINSLERQLVILELTASVCLALWKAKVNRTSFTFYNLSTDKLIGCVDLMIFHEI